MFSRPRPFVAAMALATLLLGLETPGATAGPLPSWTYSTSFVSWHDGVPSRVGFANSNDDPRENTTATVVFQGVSATPGKTSAPILIGTTILPDLNTTTTKMDWTFDPANNLIGAQIQITDANHQSGSAAFRFHVGGGFVGFRYSGELPIPADQVDLAYTLDGAASQAVPIGGNVYTISFGTIDFGHYLENQGPAIAGALTASVSVAPINNAPEPSGLVLAVMGLVGSASLIRRRTHYRRGRAADHGCCV